MAPSRRIAALVAVTALALSACSSNDADAGDIEEAMRDAGLTDEQASCIAEQLDAELDQDQLNDLASASDVEDLGEDLEAPVTAAVEDCVGPVGDSGTSEGSGDSEGGEPSDSTEGSDEGGEPSDSTEGTSDTTADEGGASTTATTAG